MPGFSEIGFARFIVGFVSAAILASPVTSAEIAYPPNDPPGPLINTSVGWVMVAPHGMTLYVSDNDAGLGESSCEGAYRYEWPPYVAPVDANLRTFPGAPNDAAYPDWSVIRRHDGVRQWAYRGKPLYLSVLDKYPGETNGDEHDQVWHVARPIGWKAPYSRAFFGGEKS